MTPISTIIPPLMRERIRPSTTFSSLYDFSSSSQTFILSAFSLDRIRFPSASSRSSIYTCIRSLTLRACSSSFENWSVGMIPSDLYPISTTTLSLLIATTRPSMMLPSSKFLNVSSYRAARVPRSNCSSVCFDPISIRAIPILRRRSVLIVDSTQLSLSVVRLSCRRGDVPQFGDFHHHGPAHMSVKLLA